MALLGDIVDFLDHRRRPVTESDRRPGPYPYYGANGVQGYIDEYVFDEPLILLAEDGGYFESPERGIAYRISGKTWVNNHAHVLRPRSQVDLAYLCRVLENYDVSAFVSGTTRGKLTKARASQLPIPLPPLDEQRRIAAILDQTDDLRRKRALALERLTVLPQAIFHEMFGRLVSGSEPCMRKPLEALTTKIGSGATPTGGESAYQSTGIALIRSMNVRDGHFLPEGLAFLSDEQAAKLDIVAVQNDDVLINITGASVTRVCRAPEFVLPARVNQHVSIVRPTDELAPAFLEAFFLYPPIKNRLMMIAQSGATRQAITKSALDSFEIPVPPRSLQDQYASRTCAITATKLLQLRAVIKLDQLFASLQQGAFEGTLTPSSVEAALASV
jgi:type I restriction enzyme S subunit